MSFFSPNLIIACWLWILKRKTNPLVIHFCLVLLLVQTILVWSILFWTGPNNIGQGQKAKFIAWKNMGGYYLAKEAAFYETKPNIKAKCPALIMAKLLNLFCLQKTLLSTPSGLLALLCGFFINFWRYWCQKCLETLPSESATDNSRRFLNLNQNKIPNVKRMWKVERNEKIELRRRSFFF